jgi:hypothetical protein
VVGSFLYGLGMVPYSSINPGSVALDPVHIAVWLVLLSAGVRIAVEDPRPWR